MKPDREPNRLPLRAGAMLLFAVAIVFIGLGWHSAASGGDDDSSSRNAGSSSQGEQTETTGSDDSETAETSGSAETTGTSGSATTTETTGDDSLPTLCVLNAGRVDGLAATTTEQLEGAGYTVESVTMPNSDVPNNYPGGGFTENTIFFGEGQRSAADTLAALLPGEVSVEERPSTFTQCQGNVVVFMVYDS